MPMPLEGFIGLYEISTRGALKRVPRSGYTEHTYKLKTLDCGGAGYKVSRDGTKFTFRQADLVTLARAEGDGRIEREHEQRWSAHLAALAERRQEQRDRAARRYLPEPTAPIQTRVTETAQVPFDTGHLSRMGEMLREWLAPGQWFLSAQGNPYTNQRGFHAVVFRRTQGDWGYVLRLQHDDPEAEPLMRGHGYASRYTAMAATYLSALDVTPPALIGCRDPVWHPAPSRWPIARVRGGSVDRQPPSPLTTPRP
jgi:hypothetical protein